MRPERALGLLARARQVVLFGDEMLLPASTFAQRHAVGAVELAEQKADQPSLWETLGGAVEHRVLRGQYRVRAASLLAFANRHFYRNEIRVLPAPQETFPEPGRGLRLVRGPGTHRTGVHVTEARTVVEEALRCMREFPERSLAILTWTGAQRLFVQTELARAMARDPEAVRYRARWSAGREPLIVRQVDEAQGDVRDIVLLSLGLASEVAGVLEGAVRLEGNAGARRLNVALTRARVGMSVFCGVDPQRIRIDHRTPRGIVLLRQFLSFAAEGGISADAYSGVCIAARERFLGAILEAGGFQVAARAGAGEWRLDLVAAHPQKGPGFGWALVGDGGARAVQNRREVREWILGNALERIGWRVHRIWTGEWFRDPVRETERLREGLEGARLS
jgi:hypothetical protein